MQEQELTSLRQEESSPHLQPGLVSHLRQQRRGEGQELTGLGRVQSALTSDSNTEANVCYSLVSARSSRPSLVTAAHR